jgi:hypothetical protein
MYLRKLTIITFCMWRNGSKLKGHFLSKAQSHAGHGTAVAVYRLPERLEMSVSVCSVPRITLYRKIEIPTA